MKQTSLVCLFGLLLSLASESAGDNIGALPPVIDLLLSVPTVDGTAFAINAQTVKFTSDVSEESLQSLGAAQIEVNGQRIYIGTRQVAALNQDPIIKSFGSQAWTSTNLETSGADGRGVSLFWSGEQLFASFTIDGTQGTVEQGFARAALQAEQSWLASYGQGGGAQVSVIGEIDLANGELLRAVFISARLSNGNSNTLLVTNISLGNAETLLVEADSFFSPRGLDGLALPRTTSNPSPFSYQLELLPDLTRAIKASADDF